MTRRTTSSPLLRALRAAALVLATLLTVIVLWCLASLLMPSSLNVVTLVGTIAWSFIGPALVLMSAIALVLALVVLFRRRGRYTMVLSIVSVVALIGSAVVVGSIVGAASSAGGSVNLATAILPSSTTTAPDAVEAYTSPDGVDLDARVFAPATSDELAPVLMYIHGGGWIGGQADQFDALLTGYSEAGWLVVNVDYRLATATTATWDKAPADVACALAWTAQNAATWGGDNSRITVLGDSAGGNLAVNLAWSAALGQASSGCPELGPVPTPAAVVAGYPVINPLYSYDNGAQWLFDQRPKDFTSDYLGGTPDEYPDRLDAISSTTYISPDAPPTLIIEPDRDDFIPAEGVYDVANEAKAAGVNVTLVRIPYSHHSFDALPGSLGEQTTRTITMNYLDSLDLAP